MINANHSVFAGRSQNPFKNVRMVKTRWQDHVAEDDVRFGTEAEYSTEEALVPLFWVLPVP